MTYQVYDVNGYVGDAATIYGWSLFCKAAVRSRLPELINLAKHGYTENIRKLRHALGRMDLHVKLTGDQEAIRAALLKAAKKARLIFIISDGIVSDPDSDIVHLTARRRSFRCDIETWQDLLEIGKRHGWVPIGTGAPRGRSRRLIWDKNYLSTAGQIFYARDAEKLADALQIFLGKTRSGHALRVKKEASFGTRAGQRLLREFIAFCRRGSFRIK